MKGAYYNEFDPKVAAWLRQLIKNGDIADGEVDERSIIDVSADDLKGFTQHHFFAGVGTWSYALRNAGWPDDRPICTASLPCQPFSAAGKQQGKTDERHLLPHFIELVKQCGFNTIIGEQVPGAIKHGWLDDLYDEMEGENYTCGATVLTAAGAGKPHIRQRLYWLANAQHQRSQRRVSRGEDSLWETIKGHTGCCSSNFRLGESQCKQYERCISGHREEPSENKKRETSKPSGSSETIEWLYCADSKYRPIKPGIKPLVDGVARGLVRSCDSIITPNDSAESKTMRLKGYGNAIVSETAALFIRSVKEILDETANGLGV